MGEPQDCHYFPSVCLARVCQTLLRAAGRSWYVTLRAFSKLYAQSAEGSACGAGLLGRPYGSPGVSGCLPALKARSPRPRRGQSRPVPPRGPGPQRGSAAAAPRLLEAPPVSAATFAWGPPRVLVRLRIFAFLRMPLTWDRATQA